MSIDTGGRKLARTAEHPPGAQPALSQATPAPGTGRLRAAARAVRRGYHPYAFIAPSTLLLIMFGIVPIVLALFVSFTDLDLKGLGDHSQIRFIGLDNYTRLFDDPLFRQSVLNTLIFVGLGVPGVLAVSLSVALLLNTATNRLFRWLRALFFLPSITNIVAIAVVWGYLYQTDYGLLNHLLSLLHVDAVPWLDDPTTSRFSLALVAIWRGSGLNVMIFLAALQAIPAEYYEAAALDGAGRWHRLRHITLPMLRFAVFFVVVTTLIAWLQFFEEPFVLTKGGPLDATTSVSLFIYKAGFNRFEYGYASAGSFVLFLIIIIVTAIQFRSRRAELDA